MQQTLEKQAHETKQKNAWKYILSVVIVLIYILPIYVLVNMALKHPTDLGSRLLPPQRHDKNTYEKADRRCSREHITCLPFLCL